MLWKGYNRELTLPVQADSRVPEVVADFVTRHSLHSVCGFERVQNNPVLLHLPPVHLIHNGSLSRLKTHGRWHHITKRVSGNTVGNNGAVKFDDDCLLYGTIAQQTKLKKSVSFSIKE